MAGSVEIIPQLLSNTKGTTEVNNHKSQYSPAFVCSVNTMLPVTGADGVQSSDELLQSSVASGQRPSPFKQTTVRLFSLHQRSLTAFKPTQMNHSNGLNAPGFGLTVLNKAGVNMTVYCINFPLASLSTYTHIFHTLT